MAGRWGRKLATAVLAVAAAAVPVVTPTLTSVGTPQTAAGSRAMWLWSRAEAAEVVPWAAAHGVTEIFAYVETNPAPQLRRLTELRDRAADAGIRLVALNGEPDWITNPAEAVAWRDAVTATGLFTGLHIDVEPHVLPGWEANREALGTRYLSVLDRLRDGATLPIEADVAFWYGEVTVAGGHDLATSILDRVAAVTVMSYRDTAVGPNSMYEISRDWLGRGAAAGKKVRLGAETAPLEDCAHCTFAEEGATVLGTQLSILDSAAASDAAYNGISVQHYSSWRAMGA